MMRVDESKMVLGWEGYCLHRRDSRVPTTNNRTGQAMGRFRIRAKARRGDQELGGPGGGPAPSSAEGGLRRPPLPGSHIPPSPPCMQQSHSGRSLTCVGGCGIENLHYTEPVSEAAQLLGIDRTTAYRLARQRFGWGSGCW